MDINIHRVASVELSKIQTHSLTDSATQRKIPYSVRTFTITTEEGERHTITLFVGEVASLKS